MPDKKSGDFDETSIRELAKDKPVVYHLDNAQGKTLYTGVAKRGRVSDRLSEHLPGGIDPIKGAARVRIQQKASIADAEKAEAKAIKSLQPPFIEIPTLISRDFFCPFPQCWRGSAHFPLERSSCVV